MVLTTGHTTLTQAYAGTGNGATIKARAITFIENLVLNGNRQVTLEGGFDAEYDCNSCGGNTILEGTMTIEQGSVIMENVTIR
ncbi:MAG: hypothetical protein A2X85_01875 [Geobacteraceae bacterium GWF2_54_21]|nr:MAG: hypothetical protein A2X85_01875 [Geobacteraceae bacterium GWF2_54_21]